MLLLRCSMPRIGGFLLIEILFPKVSPQGQKKKKSHLYVDWKMVNSDVCLHTYILLLMLPKKGFSAQYNYKLRI